MLVIKISNIWSHLILPKFKDFKVCILRRKNLHPKVKGPSNTKNNKDLSLSLNKNQINIKQK